ncbi:MAG: hypothetical protein ACP5UU_05840 [Thermoprotei archaeon]
MSIYVTLWFDTEDYVSPESDDAAKELADILTSNGVRGTFKLVGEMLRKLEERGRKDVIDSLKKHDIGFHTEYHSLHPTVAEYERGKGMEEGASEFEKREGRGVEEIKRIFGTNPSCYGQPGDSWAPQVYLALKKLGIPVYLDETHFVDVNGGPFWYCGVLNVVRLTLPKGKIMGINFELGTKGFVEQAKKEFDEAYEKIKSERSWGIISIYNHPNTLVAQEFWDVVNFARGENTPLDQLKHPRLKPKDWVDAGYRDFEEFVRYMKSKDVVFVTASDLLKIFGDRAQSALFSVEGLASSLKPELISWREVEGTFLSASEIFWLVVHALASYSENKKLPSRVLNRYPLGPFSPFQSEGLPEVSIEEFLSSCATTRDFLETEGRIPDSVQVGKWKISPKDFLSTATMVLRQLARGESPQNVKVIEGVFEPAAHISYEGAKAAWEWVIFPEGFEAWDLVELAKLQAWTLKPAEPSQA